MPFLENYTKDDEQVQIDAGEINLVQHIAEMISLDS
jgi:hypothetical protein